MLNRDRVSEFFSEAGLDTFRYSDINRVIENLILSIPYRGSTEIVFRHTNQSSIRYYTDYKGNVKVFEGRIEDWSAPDAGSHVRQDFSVSEEYSGIVIIEETDSGIPEFLTEFCNWLSLFVSSYLRQKRETAEREAFAAERALSYFKHNSSNLLCGISGLIEIIDQECSTSNVHNTLSSISTAVETFEKELSQVRSIITRDYRDIIDMERVDVSELLRNEVRYRDQIGVFGECITDIRDGIVIKGEQELLKKAFNHIFDNIVESDEEKCYVEISLGQEGGNCIIVFKNKGEYIPFWDQEIVFYPLVSLRKSRALGLGLVYVKNIVERHRGTIELSRPENFKGAVLSVRIPLIRDRDFEN